MKNKKLIIALIALVAVIAVMAGISLAMKPETTQGGKSITVTVVHKDGTEKVFTYQTDEEYLGAVLTAEGLVTGYEGDYGLVIESVDGETADWSVDSSYWALYIGEEYATTGAGTTPIYDGSVFKLEYTIG